MANHKINKFNCKCDFLLPKQHQFNLINYSVTKFFKIFYSRVVMPLFSALHLFKTLEALAIELVK